YEYIGGKKQRTQVIGTVLISVAMATVIRFLFMAGSAGDFASQRAYPIPYKRGRTVTPLALSAIFYFASTLVPLAPLIMVIALKIALFATFPCLLYLIGFFDQVELANMKHAMQ